MRRAASPRGRARPARAVAGLALTLLAAASVAGCRTEIFLVIDGDLATGSEIDGLDVALSSAGGELLTSQSYDLEGGSSLPETLAIYRGDSTGEVIQVLVTSRLGGTPVLSAERELRFEPGDRVERRICLYRRCIDSGSEDCLQGLCGASDGDGDSDVDGDVDGDADTDADADVETDGDADPDEDVEHEPPACIDPACVNLVECSGVCADLARDSAHCGDCTTSCRPGEGCVSRSCTACSGSLPDLCGGTCVDTSADPLDCGGCWAVCGRDQACRGSTCVAASPGERCTVPLDLGSATGVTSASLERDWLTSHVPACAAVDLRDGLALRWTAPADGTYRFELEASGSGGGPIAVSVELFSDADEDCRCQLPGACATVSRSRSSASSIDRAVAAGESLRLVVGADRRTSSSTFTVTAL